MPSLVEYHIARLKDKNPEVRIKSARELALIGDAAALEALEELFRTDPDPIVRRVAQAAGRAIYLRQKESEQGDD